MHLFRLNRNHTAQMILLFGQCQWANTNTGQSLECAYRIFEEFRFNASFAKTRHWSNFKWDRRRWKERMRNGSEKFEECEEFLSKKKNNKTEQIFNIPILWQQCLIVIIIICFGKTICDRWFLEEFPSAFNEIMWNISILLRIIDTEFFQFLTLLD